MYSHLPHGVASKGFTTAYDTVSSHRHLDITGSRSGDFGSPGIATSGSPPKFVQVSRGPSGYSEDVKLQDSTCNIAPQAIAYTHADPVRWGGRFSIGQARFNTPQNVFDAARPARTVPNGYTRISDPMFTGQAGSGKPGPAPLALGATMSTIIPSGYALAHKDAALAESWRAGDLGSARFEAPSAAAAHDATPPAIMPSNWSAYTRSLSSGRAPFTHSYETTLHPTQARLRALAEPFDMDPHAHKQRSPR